MLTTLVPVRSGLQNVFHGLSSAIHTDLTRRGPVDLTLCLIANSSGLKEQWRFSQVVQAAAEGLLSLVQLRDPVEEICATLSTARLLQPHIQVVINNRVDVALAIRAGVHLGQRDFPLKEAKRLMGELICGLTVESLDEVEQAEELEVDYLGLQIFPSKRTKPFSSRPFGLEGLYRARALSRHRFLVIGGMNEANIEQVSALLRKGDGIAAAGQLNDFPLATAQKLRKLMEESDAFSLR